jgi:hypothetical protein
MFLKVSHEKVFNFRGSLTFHKTILVQTTLSAIPVHAMMYLDIPPKVVEALLKICRAFLWKGRCEISGGHCLVAWDKVASPKPLGGLGILNLRLLNLVV